MLLLTLLYDCMIVMSIMFIYIRHDRKSWMPLETEDLCIHIHAYFNGFYFLDVESCYR